MFYGRVAVRRLARQQDQIIAVSDHTARDLATFFGLPPRRVTVIHNGLDHERFSPGSRPEARAAVALRRGIYEPFFLYIARLEHPAKNHVRLIAAFNQFKAETKSPWQLVLGGSDWHGAETIHEAIRVSPFARDIFRLGFVPDDALPLWYRAAEVFVYPSLFEGFGLPPLEAMACACPVLASARGAVGEVCGAAAAFMDAENVGQIKSQLTCLAEDEGLREQLRSAGLVHARRFDWRRTAAATLEVYARAANGVKPRAAMPPLIQQPVSR
jgi:glycosyltransferase involved in cell wall biosynthesis